jgi:hypothetical protein
MLPADGDELEPLAAVPGRRELGRDAVEALAARVHALRLADDVLASGDLVAPAFRELHAAVTLFKDSSHVDDVGRALLVQVGELAQIAGWIASDGGWHAQAERAYRLGATAARQADDRQLLTHAQVRRSRRWPRWAGRTRPCRSRQGRNRRAGRTG